MTIAFCFTWDFLVGKYKYNKIAGYQLFISMKMHTINWNMIDDRLNNVRQPRFAQNSNAYSFLS